MPRLSKQDEEEKGVNTGYEEMPDTVPPVRRPGTYYEEVRFEAPDTGFLSMEHLLSIVNGNSRHGDIESLRGWAARTIMLRILEDADRVLLLQAEQVSGTVNWAMDRLREGKAVCHLNERNRWFELAPDGTIVRSDGGGRFSALQNLPYAEGYLMWRKDTG
jgi:hypothetical protein